MSTSLTRDPDVREGYAADFSGLRMLPDAVARPSTSEEVVEILRQASADAEPVTAAGGQTSLTGASVTDRGILLSLRALNRILDIDPVRRVARVEPGVIVSDLAAAAGEAGTLFAPDPTSEVDATVGGAVACNASGARALLYGPTRGHVRALKVALISGDVVELRRPPALEKNTAGYALAHDPVDWFVGSEGTLGVVLEAEFALLPKPERIFGLAVPFESEPAALGFVVAARQTPGVTPRCLEYFDALSAALFVSNGAAEVGATSPPLVYLEQTHAGDEEPPFDPWLELAERHGALADDIAVYADDVALRSARRQRHAVPSRLGERSARMRSGGGRKVSTDWAVPYQRLPEVVAFLRTRCDEAGLVQPFIFGHAGNGHPHTNFHCPTPEVLDRAEQVVEETLRRVLALGGTVAAEHGIGKLKSRWLPLQLSPLQLSVMRAVKRELDPRGLLAPGNIV